MVTLCSGSSLAVTVAPTASHVYHVYGIVWIIGILSWRNHIHVACTTQVHNYTCAYMML